MPKASETFGSFYFGPKGLSSARKSIRALSCFLAVEAGIAAALVHEGPVLVDAVASRTELVMPPAVTTEMATGFTLYMVKAVMSGRGDELLELARTNLWR